VTWAGSLDAAAARALAALLKAPPVWLCYATVALALRFAGDSDINLK
jgi:hypothetical protein